MRFLGMILLVVALLVLWDVGWWKLGDVEPIAPWRLRALINEGEKITVLDVRTPGEYDSFHIPGAINVPFPASLNDLARLMPNPNQAIVVVCMTGHRSPPVVRQLQKGGYTNVANLTWGMAAWKLFGGKSVQGR
jgi:rhodanese-related sulfurtransferase